MKIKRFIILMFVGLLTSAAIQAQTNTQHISKLELGKKKKTIF